MFRQHTKIRTAGDLRTLAARRWMAGAWQLPAIVLAVMVALTVALWRAEMHLELRAPGHSVQWVLWGGLTVSILLSAAVFQAIVHRARRNEQARRHQEALEELSALSAAINSRLGTGAGVLEQLAESARQLLDMERCSVRLLDDRDKALRIVASAGDLRSPIPSRFRLEDVPTCRQSLETGEIVLDGDIRRSGREVSSVDAKAMNAVALIAIPLQSEGRQMGVLVLSRSQPRKFTEFDRRLAGLLGAQAAVLLSNSRMYQQMKDALASRTRLLRQRRALAAANAVIQSSDPLHDSLQQIARIVPAAVGTDLCALSLMTGPGLDSVVAAATPPFDTLVGNAIAGTNPAAEHVFATAEPLVIRDARNDRRLHEAWRKVPGVGSMLYVPMFHSDRRPLGIFALVRYVTGHFSREQVELAQTFAAVTAVAVENARLLEQKSRDADAKTVLLRELNHRVKNNLAGIVGLLSMDVPDMSPPGRQWLERVTERIRVMAGAHQLFTGEEQSVDLKDLVRQTVSSLSVARHPGVTVKTQTDAVVARLRGDRAVSLAMALHEICYNALVHGLGGGGTLTIRARHADGRRVVIDVIDQGGKAPADATADASPHRTGHGLDLVRGLVRRELHGTFELRPATDHGTVATIEFPLKGDEQKGQS